MLRSLANPLRSKKDILGSITALTASGMVQTFVCVVAGILQGRLITPGVLGAFGQYGILVGWMSMLHLGAYSVLQRDYPYYIGTGEKDKALNAASLSLGWTIIICICSLLVFLVLALYDLIHANYLGTLAFLSSGFTCVCTFYSLYLHSTYRSSTEFMIWSKAQFIASIYAALSIAAFYFGFIGLCIRSVITGGAGLRYAYKYRPVRVSPIFSVSQTVGMLKFGFPLFLSNILVVTVIDNVMQMLIRYRIGVRALGLYLFAISVLYAVNGISTSIAQVFSPRMTTEYGRNGSITNCTKYTFKCMVLGLAVIIPVIIAIRYVMPPMLKMLTPKYTEAIPIALPLMWCTLFQLFQLPIAALTAMKDIKALVASSLIGAAIFLIPALLAYSGHILKPSMSTLIYGYVFGKVGYTLVAFGFLLRRSYQEIRSRKRIVGEAA